MAMSMSFWVTPAMAKAGSWLCLAAMYIRSRLPAPWWAMASPTPSTQTGVWRQLRATSGDATTTAPPPSVMTQQSGRCRGEEITRELTMSSTVTGSRNRASGFMEACLRMATATSASCSEVVP